MTKSGNIAWHEPLVTRDARQGPNGHRSVVVWLAGLSGSAENQPSPMLLREDFMRSDAASFVLDGDNIRDWLYGDLGFSEEDRDQNILRMGGQARAGEVYDCTGIPSRHQQPDRPELVVDTGRLPLNQCVGQVTEYLQGRGVLSPS